MATRKKSEDNNYWISYADLMTGFLIVFIILTFVVYVNSNKRVNKIRNMYQHCDSTVRSLNDTINGLQGEIADIRVLLEEYKKLEEIKSSIKYIDTTLFTYNERYKKHILNIDVQFRKGSHDINDMTHYRKNLLVKAGKKIKSLIKESFSKDHNIKYLLVVEGQSSLDSFKGNDTLSFLRALSLKHLWVNNNIDFENLKNCELIIAGSGTGGVPRVHPDKSPKNQRFLIQIIPKIGEINRDLLK